MTIGHETWEECRRRSEETIDGELVWCSYCELTHRYLGLPCDDHTREEEREQREQLFDARWPEYVRRIATLPLPS